MGIFAVLLTRVLCDTMHPKEMMLMTKKAQANLRYTLATHAAEKMSPSREAIALCEKIADGHISGDFAVEQIKRRYGVESRRAHV